MSVSTHRTVKRLVACRDGDKCQRYQKGKCRFAHTAAHNVESKHDCRSAKIPNYDVVRQTRDVNIDIKNYQQQSVKIPCCTLIQQTRDIKYYQQQLTHEQTRDISANRALAEKRFDEMRNSDKYQAKLRMCETDEQMCDEYIAQQYDISYQIYALNGMSTDGYFTFTKEMLDWAIPKLQEMAFELFEPLIESRHLYRDVVNIIIGYATVTHKSQYCIMNNCMESLKVPDYTVCSESGEIALPIICGKHIKCTHCGGYCTKCCYGYNDYDEYYERDDNIKSCKCIVQSIELGCSHPEYTAPDVDDGDDDRNYYTADELEDMRERVREDAYDEWRRQQRHPLGHRC
ncbi:MAG: hypothetical protein Faunusvirus4_27 [Faunusvirus sp.]|jgi:hypothetical protein|uniref:C3H1-type domain-containing protein n=1 Tax=Faunusvirus sp. TaxID=2487766 RepID=A0A3G4ZWB6_9VIRU|nr:MAG: hypothetical protein Faunusvirus4_27 [Faunusvirus sp.]